MHSFLLISTNEKIVVAKASEICASLGISQFDQTVLQKEKNIGIEDIRQLQKNLSLSPLQGTHKAAIIYQADTMSIDAQNAFLKTLEEPPAHTIIILLGKDKEAFLPTVLSRCSIQEFSASEKKEPLSHTEITQMMATIDTATIGQRLAMAEKIAKTKDGALQWTISAQVLLREELLKSKKTKEVTLIRKLQETQKTLAYTNANTRAVMEQLFLSL